MRSDQRHVAFIPHVSKAITRDEARYILIKSLIEVANYWACESRAKDSAAQCSGVIFSTLVNFDGGAMGPPGYEFQGEDGEDWAGALHEHFHQYERGEHVCEDNPPRHEFMKEVVEISKKWGKSEIMTSGQVCQETLLDFLTLIDGDGAIPRPKIVPSSHPSDAEYAREQGYDYYPEEADSYDIGEGLNALAHEIILGEVTKPEGLYDFGDHLVDDAKRMGFV